MSRRYAIYLAPPPESALWRFASRVIGRDAASGESFTDFAPAGYSPESWRELTREPRRYGFHATIKPPFRLAEGRTQAELEAAIGSLTADFAAFEIGPLAVGSVAFAGGAFVALLPARMRPELKALEAGVVRGLDAFRAPPTAAEWARRRPDKLTPRQRDYLSAWGYPYVLEEFRLHFTLSGATDDADALAAALADSFARSGASSNYLVDALVLFAQDGDEGFRILRRFEFAASG